MPMTRTRSTTKARTTVVPPPTPVPKAAKTPRLQMPVRKIENQRKSNATFSKRKKGLFKKAYELGKLCDVEVLVHIIPKKPGAKVFQFSSNIEPLENISRIVETEEKDTLTVTSADYEGRNADESSSDETSTRTSTQRPTSTLSAPATSASALAPSSFRAHRSASIGSTSTVSVSLPVSAQDRPPPAPSEPEVVGEIPVAQSMFVLPPGAILMAQQGNSVLPSPRTDLFPEVCQNNALDSPRTLVEDVVFQSPNGTPAQPLARTESYGELSSAVSGWWADPTADSSLKHNID